MTKRVIAVDLGFFDAVTLDGTLDEAKATIQELIDRHGGDCKISFAHLNHEWDVFNVSSKRLETDAEYERRLRLEAEFRENELMILRQRAEAIGFELKAKE